MESDAEEPPGSDERRDGGDEAPRVADRRGVSRRSTGRRRAGQARGNRGRRFEDALHPHADRARSGAGEMTPLLEARALVVVREGRRILDGASILVRPGEAVAIQGPSGSGKSTLARTLATLVEADAGTILLDGQDAREIAPTQFRTRVAFLAQHPPMFASTVRDNPD